MFTFEVNDNSLLTHDTQWERIDYRECFFEVSNDHQQVRSLINWEAEGSMRIQNSLPQLGAIQPYQPDSEIPNIPVVVPHNARQAWCSLTVNPSDGKRHASKHHRLVCLEYLPLRLETGCFYLSYVFPRGNRQIHIASSSRIFFTPIERRDTDPNLFESLTGCSPPSYMYDRGGG